MRALVTAAAIIGLWPASSIAQTKLPALVQRASVYVDDFVSRFSSIVAEETYVQKERGPHRTRELRSDFLLVKPPGETSWYQFRDVIDVDGKPVGDREQRLARLFLEAAPNAVENAERVTRESAQYNLEDVGTLNKPLLAISFLQARYVSHFQFTTGFRDKDVSPSARLVQFSEWMTPTILRSGSANRDLRARGRVWIDEASGRVVKTELDFGKDDDPDYVITTFRFDDDLQVAVPVEMRERWRFRGQR
jgi:hypothetical protein